MLKSPSYGHHHGRAVREQAGPAMLAKDAAMALEHGDFGSDNGIALLSAAVTKVLASADAEAGAGGPSARTRCRPTR